jgi:hypothetical protein
VRRQEDTFPRPPCLPDLASCPAALTAAAKRKSRRLAAKWTYSPACMAPAFSTAAKHKSFPLPPSNRQHFREGQKAFKYGGRKRQAERSTRAGQRRSGARWRCSLSLMASESGVFSWTMSSPAMPPTRRGATWAVRAVKPGLVRSKKVDWLPQKASLHAYRCGPGAGQGCLRSVPFVPCWTPLTR